MATHTSATVREETPHPNQTTRTNTIINALKRRAQAVLNDESIDPQTRAIIRYGLETNDPWLAELVRRADAGETITDENLFEAETGQGSHADAGEDKISGDEKIEALADMICRSGDEPEIKSAALLVLMSVIEKAAHPKAVTNVVKHAAFAHCGELNAYNMVESQVAVLERDLFAQNGTS